MRSLCLTIDGETGVFPIEQAYLLTDSSRGQPGQFIRLPLFLLSQNATIELPIQAGFWSAVPYLIALPEGLFVGVSALFSEQQTAEADRHRYLIKPIGSEPVKWRTICDHWRDIRLTVVNKGKKDRVCSQVAWEALLTPEAYFQMLESQVENVILPGTILFLEPKYYTMSIRPDQQFQILLENAQQNFRIFHEYAICCL